MENDFEAVVDGTEKLKKDLKKKIKDPFKTGAVIRFSRFDGRYLYCVLKAGDKWYSTATDRSDWAVPKEMDYEKLLDVLATSSDIVIASEWSNLL